MGTTESFLLPIQALVDLLGREDPGGLEGLQRAYPSYKRALEPGKKLGDEAPPTEQLLQDLARLTIGAAKREGQTTSQQIQRKIRVSGRLRLVGAIVSSLSSGTFMAALSQGSTRAAWVGGAIAFASSSFTLIAQYVEDYAGGKSSLREQRERISVLLAQVWDAEAEFGVMSATRDFGGLLELVRKLSVVTSTIRQIQLALD